jgi:hypothetical protein
MAGWQSTIPENSSTTSYSMLARLLAALAEEFCGDPSIFVTCSHDEIELTRNFKRLAELLTYMKTIRLKKKKEIVTTVPFVIRFVAYLNMELYLVKICVL